MVYIYSTDKIETLIGHLQSEISQRNLNPTLAKMFLYVMWTSRLENEIILRPKFTFSISEFNRYLNFYKRVNLLHRCFEPNRFSLDEDLYQSNDVTVEIKDKYTVDYILELGEEILEIKYYYTEV